MISYISHSCKSFVMKICSFSSIYFFIQLFIYCVSVWACGNLFYPVGCNPILSLLCCSNCSKCGDWKLFQVGSFFLLVFWHYRMYQVHLQCLPTPALELAFSWKWYLETRTWVLGVLIATGVLLLVLGTLNEQSEEMFVYILIQVYTLPVFLSLP